MLCLTLPSRAAQRARRETPVRLVRQVPLVQLAQLVRQVQLARPDLLAQPVLRQRLPSAAYPREIRVRMPQFQIPATPITPYWTLPFHAAQRVRRGTPDLPAQPVRPVTRLR